MATKLKFKVVSVSSDEHGTNAIMNSLDEFKPEEVLRGTSSQYTFSIRTHPGVPPMNLKYGDVKTVTLE